MSNLITLWYNVEHTRKGILLRYQYSNMKHAECWVSTDLEYMQEQLKRLSVNANIVLELNDKGKEVYANG